MILVLRCQRALRWRCRSSLELLLGVRPVWCRSDPAYSAAVDDVLGAGDRGGAVADEEHRSSATSSDSAGRPSGIADQRSMSRLSAWSREGPWWRFAPRAVRQPTCG